MEIPLLDAIDLEILMHRDVHFGKSFDIMLEYYQEDRVGIMPDFETDRIEELKKLEESLDEGLSEKVLPLPAQEEVTRAQKLYQNLRDVYQQSEEIPTLISDLILSEEEGAEKEIAALVAKGEEVIKPLMQMIESSDFYNPLNPGYGRAPAHAAKALGKIGGTQAIPALFGNIGQDFTIDEALISALISLGEDAQDFLLTQLQKKPFSKDNEHAAIVLSSFPENEEIAKVSLAMLTDQTDPPPQTLSSYLICCCEGLKGEEDRNLFISLGESVEAYANLKAEFQIIANSWKSASQ